MSVFASMSGLQATALRMTGIAAVSLATSLTSATALAQDASPSSVDNYSARTAPSYNPYRPEPRQPHAFGFDHGNRIDVRYDGETISEEIPWYMERDGRLGIFAVFSAIVIGVALVGLHLIHKHKDEIDNRPS